MTVNSGTLHCDGREGIGAVTITTNEGTYWINGLAWNRAGENNWRDRNEIWRADPNFDRAKIDIGPLEDRGLALCWGADD